MQAQVVPCNFRSFAVSCIFLRAVVSRSVISLQSENQPHSDSCYCTALPTCLCALSMRACSDTCDCVTFGLSDCPQEALLASALHSFVATDEPGPSTSPPDQPWLASSTLHSSTPEADTRPNIAEPMQNDPWNPPQSGDALHSEQTQMLRGHPVRKVEIIACREPCQRCTLAMCGFQTENPLDSHFAGQGKHTCKRCYRSIRDRNIGSPDAQQQDSWGQGDGSWQQGDGSWWGGNWGSSRW